MKLGSAVWHCHRTSTEGADIITYANPVEYKTRFNYITVQPTSAKIYGASGNYATVDFGEQTVNGWIMTANYDAFEGKITAGDLMYLDGKSPTSGSTNGDGANAIVSSVREQNKIIYYTLDKLDGA